MPSRLQSIRLWISAVILLAASVSLRGVSHGERIVAREPLHNLPYQLAYWRGEERPLQPQIVEAVSVTDYTNRLYSDPAAEPILLYIGYYASQRTGSTIHSPKNCLPGAGWDPIRSGYATVSLTAGQAIVVNEYVIQRDQDKQLVFYWYQGRGRVTASEYSGKFWMVADAISRNRTDGALIRIITPIRNGDAEARARLVAFTQALVPHLNEVIPN
jgi:EpsI family protein